NNNMRSNFVFKTNNHIIEGDNLDLLFSSMTALSDNIHNSIQDPGSRIYGSMRQNLWVPITVG
ncbi:hypothetical protein, partial [Yersinia frederiksenii]|uniref:hypothetical protein n=1 Tax=Yersinia frederiksenii TaxID=29484 RepID=UPI001C986757